MMEPTDLRDGNHVSLRRRFDRTRKRRVPHQRQMRARFVVVGSVTCQDPPQVILAEDDEMVGALAPDGADHPSAYGFCQGDRRVVMTSSIPMFLTRRRKTTP